jgi:hypothetical protein
MRKDLFRLPGVVGAPAEWIPKLKAPNSNMQGLEKFQQANFKTQASVFF